MREGFGRGSDRAVMETSDDAAVAKLAAVQKGYYRVRGSLGSVLELTALFAANHIGTTQSNTHNNTFAKCMSMGETQCGLAPECMAGC